MTDKPGLTDASLPQERNAVSSGKRLRDDVHEYATPLSMEKAPAEPAALPEPQVFWCGQGGMVEELPHDDGCWTRYVFKRDYDKLRAECERLRGEIKALTHDGRQGELEQANVRLATENDILRSLFEEWLETELDSMDEEYDKWLESFTDRVKATLAETPDYAAIDAAKEKP